MCIEQKVSFMCDMYNVKRYRRARLRTGSAPEPATPHGSGSRDCLVALRGVGSSRGQGLRPWPGPPSLRPWPGPPSLGWRGRGLPHRGLARIRPRPSVRSRRDALSLTLSLSLSLSDNKFAAAQARSSLGQCMARRRSLLARLRAINWPRSAPGSTRPCKGQGRVARARASK